jgi:hypothetical protein
MKTHQWLSHALIRASGPVRSAPSKHCAGSAHARAVRGILISTLVLSSLVAVAAALTSNGSVGHISVLHAIAMPMMY